jgi:SAM-dependent methyltransferase
MRRHRIRLPAVDPHRLDQDEAYFLLTEPSGEEARIRFHDYDEIYRRPGLYEQLFYDRLKCCSPKKVVDILDYTLGTAAATFSELRILDVGAGNGIVGLDISTAARDAAERDRAGVYDQYYVTDLCALEDAQREELAEWRFNCMVTVAALGFGDIPVRAFRESFNLVEDGGWIAFNIKETFLDNRDTSGFSVFVKNLILTEHLDVYHIERYRHRLSLDGRPLHYFGVAGRKSSAIPESMLG